MSIQNNTTELQAILAAVNALPDAGEGGVNPTGTIEITENGTHDVTNYASAEVNVPDIPAVTEELNIAANGEYTPDEGVDGFSKVTVNVPSEEPVLQEKAVTENGEVTPDSGYDGLSKVVVEVPDIPAVVEPLEITENGTYEAPDGVDGYNPVTVNVPSEEPVLQSKTVTPSTGQQVVTPDSGYDGLEQVTVEAMPTVEQAKPIIAVSDNGLITAYAMQDEGYVQAGTRSAATQLSTQGGTTITPGAEEQVAVPAGTYVTGDIKVAATEDLEAEIEAQAALIEEQAGQIEELLTVLDGKAASGGTDAIETCTLRIVGVEDTVGGIGAVSRLTYPMLNGDGNIEWVCNEYEDPATLVELENVVVGELLWMEFTSTMDMNAYITEIENAEVVYTDVVCTITYVKCTTPDAVSVITLEGSH